MKSKFWPSVFIIYTRYLIGGAFVFASLIKLKGIRFTTESGADSPIDTAWHFFETLYQSGLYWQFIGLGQLIAGMLLMTQRFATLGAICNFPIIVNIFVITISYDFAYTPVITGLMLIANLLLLCWDWDKLKILLNLPPNLNQIRTVEQEMIWTQTGIVLFTFTFLYRLIIDRYNLFFWMLICFLIGLTALFMGIWNRSRSKAR